jgi:hypothetical protein
MIPQARIRNISARSSRRPWARRERMTLRGRRQVATMSRETLIRSACDAAATATAPAAADVILQPRSSISSIASARKASTRRSVASDAGTPRERR